jgi:hydroxyacylglutathione hydrolase
MVAESKLVFNKFEPAIFLTDGQSLTGYIPNAKIIHLPGHTEGTIGILTDEDDFISGDTLFNSKKPNIVTFVDDFQELNNSTSKFKLNKR